MDKAILDVGGETVEYSVGDKYAQMTEWGGAVIYEIIAIAPSFDSDGHRTVFVKEINIPLDPYGNEETTEPRTLGYHSYYDWVVVFGDKFEGNYVYGLEI